MGMDLLMPKYRVTYSQYKVKVIRASSLDIAEERAKKAETGRWELTEVRDEPNE
jgi:hypothetical protein